MKAPIEAVRKYFDARTSIWLTGDPDAFFGMGRPNKVEKWNERMVHQAERKRQAYQLQGKRLLRAHAKVNVIKLDVAADGKSANVVADERIFWTYADARDIGVECRTIHHKQMWVRVDDDWRLRKAEESWDGNSVVDDTREVVVNAPLRLPAERANSQRVYDRLRATRYADVWWDSANPRYPKFSDDCTNYISQCLHAGGIPMVGEGDRNRGWWMKSTSTTSNQWSYSWTSSNALYRFVRKSVGGELVSQANELKMGDLIFYDWDGRGSYHHTTVVTEFDHAGEPLVNAHTDDSFHRPYLYYDSRAWTSSTRYAFVHIPDNLPL